METHSIAGGWLGTYYYDSYEEAAQPESESDLIGAPR
jgi:hypothetical protein